MNKQEKLIEELEKTLLEFDTYKKRYKEQASHHRVQRYEDSENGQGDYHLAYENLNEGAYRAIKFAMDKISSTMMELNFKHAKIVEGGKV